MSNPFILLAFGVVVVFVLMFILVKPDKGKKKKVEKALPPKEEKKVEEKPKEEESEETLVIVSGESEKEKKTDENLKEEKSEVKKTKSVKKSKQKPEITQVYKRTIVETKTDDNADVGDDSKSDLAKRAQFVKSTGKVSKLVGFSDIVEEELKAVESLTEQPVQDYQEGCEACEKKVKHFDHSRRLSKMVQDGSFDDMLEAHISEKYLNINVDKHLKMGDDFSEKLFDRALKTLSNSASKVLVEDEDNAEGVPVAKIKNDKEFMKSWLEERKREELARIMVTSDSGSENEVSDEFVEKVSHDVDLSPKNIVVVDALLKRKGTGRNKK